MEQRLGVDGPAATGGAEAFLPVQAFLSLFLVLLAFFIMLATASQPEASRAVKAIASVRATFPSDLPLGSPTNETTSLFVDADRALPGRVGRLVEADLPIAPPRRDPSTGQIAAEMPLDVLFGQDGLTAPGRAFLHRVAAFLAVPPEGARLVVTALVPDSDGLAVERATRIARSLLEDGAPPPSVTVGVERRTGPVRLLFGLAAPGGGE